MTQPVERAIHVGYEEFYILLEGRRYDHAPIDILASMSHGTHFHHQQRCRSAAPPRTLEVRNNNVCEVLSRTARTDTVNLDLSQCGNRTSAERDGGLLVIGSQGGLIEAHLAGQRDLVWEVPAGCKLVANNAQNAARRTHLDRDLGAGVEHRRH
jgi:hypothetical protein